MNRSSLQTWLCHPVWRPYHAAQQPATWLLSIIRLSPACHVALVHKARYRVCTDTYLVGGDPAFVYQQRGVKWVYPAVGVRYYVDRSEADGLLALAH